MQQTSTGRTESSRTTLRKRPRIDYSIKEKIEESEYFQEAKKSSGESSSTILFGDSDDERDFEITTPKSKTSKTAGTSSKKLDRLSVEGEEHSLDHGESSKIRKRGW